MPGYYEVIKKIKAYSIFIILSIFLLPLTSIAENDWFFSFYEGKFSNTALNEVVRFDTSFENSYIHVLSIGKEAGIWRKKIGLELEGQMAIHSGLQDFEEVNALLTFRWLPFPWDHSLDTSFAFGNGISYTTRNPMLESREGDDNKTSQWLYYIMVEWAFSHPALSNYSLFIRIHHRSGAFGTINGIFAASNFVGLGIRYSF